MKSVYHKANVHCSVRKKKDGLGQAPYTGSWLPSRRDSALLPLRNHVPRTHAQAPIIWQCANIV